jgi:hypothetical protein
MANALRAAPLNKRQPKINGLEAIIYFRGKGPNWVDDISVVIAQLQKSSVTSIVEQFQMADRVVVYAQRSPAAGNNTNDIKSQLENVISKTIEMVWNPVTAEIALCNRTDLQGRADLEADARASINAYAQAVAKDSHLHLRSVTVEFDTTRQKSQAMLSQIRDR